MTISTKGRYALRLVLQLATNGSEVFTSLKDIAQYQNISKKYLEQIAPLLIKNNIIKANRGQTGGYTLAKPTNEITVADVLIATEGSLSPVACLKDKENICPNKDKCSTLPVWEGFEKVINDYFSSITLQKILDDNNQHIDTIGDCN